MVGFTISADFGRDRAGTAPTVLELRVHGVNNTTPAALLDLPEEAVELVAGDKLGSFWMPKADAPPPATGRRGHVPPGIRREAYSWGGMVRTTPNFGGVGAAGVVAGVAARVLYALLLPFSIGNAVQWSRRITRPSDPRRARIAPVVTAGLARLFGLALTLLYTTTAAIVSLDLLAAQCAVDTGLCTPIAGLMAPVVAWPPAARLALFALGPVLAVIVLWAVSALSRQRYDVLPGMESGIDASASDAPSDAADAPLAQPAFWANRITAHLARTHLAAALAFVAAWVATHAAMRGFTTCEGLGGWDVCVGAAAEQAPFQRFVWLAIAAAVVLAICIGVVATLPTQTLTAEEGATPPWTGWVSALTLALAIAVFAGVLVVLLFFTDAAAFAIMDDAAFRGLYGAGAVPLVIVMAGAVLALSGVVWRPWRGRRAVAWAGCGPAVFMTLALVVAVGTSTIVVVTIGDLLNSAAGAASLVRSTAADTLNVPSSYVALGTVIVASALAGVVVVVVLALVRRPRLGARAAAWGAPAQPGDEVIPPRPGVMPVSQRGLFSRMDARRVFAARLHLAEPAVAVLAVFLGIAIVIGVTWTLLAYDARVPLWGVLGVNPAPAQGFLDAAMWALAAVGVLLVAVLASGATASTPRPLGIVWDIACYLPRTGHPFGPPSFAERAVPEIAGRLFAWLSTGDPRRRAVLVAHSMGGVLAVSALGLLASSRDTRGVLDRLSLLTFGVQLRAYFGRMLPDLLGPDVLGTRPSRAPRLLAADPWATDAAAQRDDGPPSAPGVPPTVLDRLRGSLLPARGVPWVSLWRLTDYLGFPAMSTVRAGGAGGWLNRVDRYASELDTTGYMVAVGTHGEYFRTREYDAALRELGGIG